MSRNVNRSVIARAAAGAWRSRRRAIAGIAAIAILGAWAIMPSPGRSQDQPTAQVQSGVTGQVQTGVVGQAPSTTAAPVTTGQRGDRGDRNRGDRGDRPAPPNLWPAPTDRPPPPPNRWWGPDGQNSTWNRDWQTPRPWNGYRQYYPSYPNYRYYYPYGGRPYYYLPNRWYRSGIRIAPGLGVYWY